MKRLATAPLVLVAALASPPVTAAPGVSGLDVMKVNVLFVGAHPDDDGSVVATFARYGLDEGFRTGVVTVTGGEGGGNATGRESGRALGLIRRAEEQNALAFAGVAATDFLGLEDFHFTLSAEETQRRWGSGFVCDVARIVRLRRPEVVVTMWPGPGTHGQHQMAARAATLAYARGGDPSFCPAQVKDEGVQPFEPDKLYYVGRRGGADLLQVPADGISPAAHVTYAGLRSLSMMQYRSQGYDRFAKLPVPEARPDSFLLVRSRVPVEQPESHMLAGPLLPVGTSPAGVRLDADGPYRAPLGHDSDIVLTLENRTGADLDDVTLDLIGPGGWAVAPDGPVSAARVARGGELVTRFLVRPGAGAAIDHNVRLSARYSALSQGQPVTASSPVIMRPVATLSVAFLPLHDVAGYRRFALESGTEWVIETLPARVPLAVGRVSEVGLEVRNSGDQALSGPLDLDLPAGLRLLEPLYFSAPAGGATRVTARIEARTAALPEGRGSARLPIAVTDPAGGSRDEAEAFVLPAVTVPHLQAPPVIDGDLADLARLARLEIGPADLWWRAPPADEADLSATAWLGYDADALYVGLRVRDETVVCNIAPDDVRAQLRSDAVAVTVDPSGASQDTSTTLQAAAFPCTTAGWGARAFRDADARQGPADVTAPGLRAVSRRTAEGFDIEWAIPWAVMPSQPQPGDEIGLNLVLYDGDDADATAGANISQTGLAWAAFEWGGKQALPYLWGRARLEPPTAASPATGQSAPRGAR